ncbi:MAG: hypothetical protein WCJ74_03200 [bacterium]
MKNKYYVIAILILLFTACGSNGGKKFIGEWRTPDDPSPKDYVLTISENGTNYKVISGEIFNWGEGDKPVENLKTVIYSYDSKTDMLGDIGFDKEKNTILVGGMEFTKVK